MKELEYLDHCLQRVEEKYNKSPHTDWTDGDFKKLARNILNESGTIISTHTLKRLYGKIKYKEIHNLAMIPGMIILKDTIQKQFLILSSYLQK
jgi:hypothetical protein